MSGMLPTMEAQDDDKDPFDTAFYRRYKGLLAAAIRYRVPFVGILVGLLVLSGWGFQFVDKAFFPASSRPQLMLDYWAATGTRIQDVSERVKLIEEKVLSHPAAESISTFVGQGPPRFYLPVEPERPYSSYAHFVVNTKDSEGVVQLIKEGLSATCDQLVIQLVRPGVYVTVEQMLALIGRP